VQVSLAAFGSIMAIFLAGANYICTAAGFLARRWKQGHNQMVAQCAFKFLLGLTHHPLLLFLMTGGTKTSAFGIYFSFLNLRCDGPGRDLRKEATAN
jgi:hypothetical protein